MCVDAQSGITKCASTVQACLVSLRIVGEKWEGRLDKHQGGVGGGGCPSSALVGALWVPFTGVCAAAELVQHAPAIADLLQGWSFGVSCTMTPLPEGVTCTVLPLPVA